MNRRLLALLPLILLLNPAHAEKENQPCAVISKIAKGVQVIPPVGSVETRFQLEKEVSCGSMVITNQEAFWIKLSDQTVVKIAPHSFLELAAAGKHQYRIHRGSALVTAPPGISTQTWSTPNAESIFKGGIAFIQYSASERLTNVACFNRNFEFKNKFNENAVQVVRSGETSHLMIQDAEVTPTQPAVMNHGSVLTALASFDLAEADHQELVAIVKKVYDERAKSLASEIQDWEEMPDPGKSGRNLASVKPSKSVPAVDPKEANFVNAQLRAHLYGEEVPVAQAARKPASSGKSQLPDEEQVVQKKKLNRETKKLEKEIEQIKIEN